MSRDLHVGLVALLLLCCGCTQLRLPRDPLRMTVVQRQAKPIPGASGGLQLEIEDITAGQVLVTIRSGVGKAVLDTCSLKAGDVIPFELGSRRYYLSVIELRNLLTGDDFGVFELSETPPAATQPE